MIRVLLLGGTAEARELAQLLVNDGRFRVLSSLAGRVSNPKLPVGETRIGGFGGVPGLTAAAARADVLVDATHPFAGRITAHAAEAARAAQVPLVRVVRPQWEPAAGDRWHRVATVSAAADALQARPPGRAFVTTGRQDAHEFARLDRWWFLIRVVDSPTGPLPPLHRVLQSRGPYGLADERQLFVDNNIDTLITKNSGGSLVAAKLAVARELGVPVVMIDRPDPTLANAAGTTVPTARDAWAQLRSLA